MGIEWIPIEDTSRWPQLAKEGDSIPVIVTDGKYVYDGHFQNQFLDSEEPVSCVSWCDSCDERNITHWAPLPELPKMSRDTLMTLTSYCRRYQDCPLVTKGATCSSLNYFDGQKCSRFMSGLPQTESN